MPGLSHRKQTIVVRGLLVESNRVLIMREDTHPTSFEYYELPGGYVEFGKDPADALAELFFSKTRIAVEVGAPFKTLSRLSLRDGMQTVEIVYRVRAHDPVSFDNAMPKNNGLLWIEADDVGYFLSSRIAETLRTGYQ